MKALLAPIPLILSAATPALVAERVDMVSVSRGETAYVDRGEGEAIILIHGLGADLSRWKENIELLSAEHRVIALDLYGFGASDRLESAYRTQVFVDQIEELRQALSLGRVSLVGNSMGGWVAMLYADQYPDQVDKLVLVAPAFFYGVPPEVTARQLNAGAAPQTLEGMHNYLDRIYANPPTGEREMEALLAEHKAKNAGNAIPSIARSILAREDIFTPERVAAITTPTLVVHAVADSVVPVSASEAFVGTIPQGKLIIYESAGHWPQEEVAEVFNKDVAMFLSR